VITNGTALNTGSKPLCLIATATYGSTSSPEVQLLRTFRDNQIEKTKVGSSFMIVFNAWYYSFSPYVASYISTHSPARLALRFYLYPIIAILYFASGLYGALSAYPEFAILVSGLLTSALIGAIYIGLPIGLINRRFRFIKNYNSCIPTALAISGILGTFIGICSSASLVLMFSSALTVLATMFASAGCIVNCLVGRPKAESIVSTF
jgi:hypothetical protein